MIQEDVRNLLGAPSYYLDEYNSTPMINYWCLLERILSKVSPTTIVEIGSERGITTKKLIEFSKKVNSNFYAVDPHLTEAVKLLALDSDQVHAVERKSKDFFKLGVPADVYFIDGDHNYETVMLELVGAETNCKDEPLVIFLHDVSWPWAYRDLYYDTESENVGARVDVGLCLESTTVDARGFPSGSVYAVREAYGGERNGVLKAVEDFIKSSASEWSYNSIPNFFGLGCLVRRDENSESIIRYVEEEFDNLNRNSQFLGALEANRLRLIQGYNEVRDDLLKITEERDRFLSERDELYSVAEDRLNELSKLIEVADARLETIQSLDRTNAELFAVAEKRNDDLSRLVLVADDRLEMVNRLGERAKTAEQEIERIEREFERVEQEFERVEAEMGTLKGVNARLLNFEERVRSNFILNFFIKLLRI